MRIYHSLWTYTLSYLPHSHRTSFSIQSCRSCYATQYLCQRSFYKIFVKFRNCKKKNVLKIILIIVNINKVKNDHSFQINSLLKMICLNSLHSWAKMENGGLGDTIIGRIGDVCLSADCCFRDIASFLNKNKKTNKQKNTCEAGTTFGLKRHNVENVAF